MWTLLLAVVGILAVCSGVRITKVYQFENVVGGPGRHRTPWRSGASGDASLHMFKGDAIKIDLCIPIPTEIQLDDLVYSNDGLSDIIRVNLNDGAHVETIVTKENSNGWGRYWNDHVSTGKISGPLKLQTGLHSLTLTIEDADCYGTELDALFVSLNADIDDSFLWCGAEFIRSAKPSPCAPDFSMPIQPEDILATEPPLVDIYDGFAPKTNDVATNVPSQPIVTVKTVSPNIFTIATEQSLRRSTMEYKTDIQSSQTLETTTTMPQTTVQENNSSQASTNVNEVSPSYVPYNTPVPYPVVKESTTAATSISDTTKSTTNMTIYGITNNNTSMDINTTNTTKATTIVNKDTSEIANVKNKTLLNHQETSTQPSERQTTLSTTLLASIRDAIRTTKLNAETTNRVTTDKAAIYPVESSTDAAQTSPTSSTIPPTTMRSNTWVYSTRFEQSKQPGTVRSSTERAAQTVVNINQSVSDKMNTTSRYQPSTVSRRDHQLTTIYNEVTTPTIGKETATLSSEEMGSKPYLSENPQTINDSAMPVDVISDANIKLINNSTTIKPSILLTTTQMTNYASKDPETTSTSETITDALDNISTSDSSVITIQTDSVNWDIPQATDNYMAVTEPTTVPQSSGRTSFTYPTPPSTTMSATTEAAENEYMPTTMTNISPNSTVQALTNKTDTIILKTTNNPYINTSNTSSTSTNAPTSPTNSLITSISANFTPSTTTTSTSTTSASTYTTLKTPSTTSTSLPTTSTTAPVTSRTASTSFTTVFMPSTSASNTSTNVTATSTRAPTNSTGTTSTASTTSTTTSTTSAETSTTLINESTTSASAPSTSRSTLTTSTTVYFTPRDTSTTSSSAPISTRAPTTSTLASNTSTTTYITPIDISTATKSALTASKNAPTTSTSTSTISTIASTSSTTAPTTSTTATTPVASTTSTSASTTSMDVSTSTSAYTPSASAISTSTSETTISTNATTSPTSSTTTSASATTTASTTSPSAPSFSTTVSSTSTSASTAYSVVISTIVPTTTSSTSAPTPSTSTFTTSTTAATTSTSTSTTKETTTAQPSGVLSDTSVTNSHVDEPNITIGSAATPRPYHKFVEQRSYLGGCINETNVNIVFHPDTLRSLEIVAKSESKFAPSVLHISADTAVQLREKCESNVWQIGSQDGGNRELGLPLGNVRLLDFDVNSHGSSKQLFPRSLYTLSTKGVFLRYVIPNDIHFRRGRLRLTVGLFDVYNNFSIGVQYYNRARRNPSKVQYRTFSPSKQIQQWLIPIKVVSPSLENLLQLRFDDSVPNLLNFDFLRLEYIPATWKMRRMVLNRSSKWKINGQLYVERKGNKGMPDGMAVHIDGQKKAGVYADVNIVRKPNIKVLNINDDGEIYVTHNPRANKSASKGGKKQGQIITDLSGFTFGGADRRIIKVDVVPQKSEVTITYDDGHFIKCQFDYTNDKSVLKIIETSFSAVPVRFFSMYMSSDLAAVNEVIVDRMERRHIMSKYVGGNVGTTFTFMKTSNNPVFSTNSETTISFLRPRTHK